MYGPFTGFYVRYVLSWLVFGILGPVIINPYSSLYSLLSIAVAVLITFGIDAAAGVMARKKAELMVKEKAVCMVKAYRHGNGRRGYLVVTDSYMLFVPVFRKIRTVLENRNIVRKDVDGLTAEVTARVRHQYRTFTFSILTRQKLLSALEDAVKEKLPHHRSSVKKEQV
ncbi:hypothetical protein [Alteribacter natronophilus]|uniref:hypothetical protein n=1 Tax=Alteribacter natronophilus TaxID=2583810 RepID=UPI00110F2AA7|nr:hypothetical protein [Alteribacter natronophilus]TMW72095.1 hypothetical protein FGB90_07700 [Alteribacter natronophilus]